MNKLKIGSKIRITSDNENYDGYREKNWTVNGIYSNDEEHPGYDMGLHPEKLIECKNLPFALYEYEFELI